MLILSLVNKLGCIIDLCRGRQWPPYCLHTLASERMRQSGVVIDVFKPATPDYHVMFSTLCLLPTKTNAVSWTGVESFKRGKEEVSGVLF